MCSNDAMRINVVRRSSLVRVLAGLGFAMLAAPMIMLIAYAALFAACAAIVVIVAMVVAHPFRTRRPVPAAYDAHNDLAARAHRARMAAIAWSVQK